MSSITEIGQCVTIIKSGEIRPISVFAGAMIKTEKRLDKAVFVKPAGAGERGVVRWRRLAHFHIYALTDLFEPILLGQALPDQENHLAFCGK